MRKLRWNAIELVKLQYKWIFAVFLISVSMCSPQEQVMSEVAHPNGLQLEFPQTLSLQKTTNGFLLEPSNSQELRSPLQIIIELDIQQERSPREWNHSKNVNGQIIYFQITEVEGGSGGNFYTLDAWKSSAKGHIVLQQTVQAEMPIEADFNLGWAILENADILTPVHRN